MGKVWLFRQHFGYLLAIGVICLSLSIPIMVARADTAGSLVTAPAWANPRVMALRKVNPMGSAQNEPFFFNNMNCSLYTYRLVASNDMQTGCFTPTAFGRLSSDSNTAIFNGTDEALPLIPYVGGETLVPWPRSLNLIAIDQLSTDGAYISLYTNTLGFLHDERNMFGQLTGKRLTGPAQIPLKDASGQRLVINPQTMAFSDNGSWMVVETLMGAFVRVNLATLDVVPFAPAIIVQGSPALFKSRVAISDDGRYVAIANDQMSQFNVYDLAACSGGGAGPLAQRCLSHEYWSFIDGQTGGLQSIRHLRFVNEGLVSFEAVASDPSQDGTYELAPTASINFLTEYMGLGDSYTSGEGAFNYLAGTDTHDNTCHLSVHSYPLLLTQDLFGAAGGHSVACSGAVMQDIGSTSENYKGQIRNGPSLTQLRQTQSALLDSVMTNFMPGYVAQQVFVQHYQPRVMTVSIGGNDIGFGDILQNCVMPHFGDNTCYNTYEARLEVMQLIDRTVPRWTALYKQLLAQAPGTHLYAIGYPQVVDDRGNCALNVHMNKSELEFAVELINYLNGAIKKAASAAQIPYVDIGQALAGHRLCETASYNVAVNGLTAGNDFGALGVGVLGRESYHPNALGHELIEQAILRQTHNLKNGFQSESSPSTSNADALLVVPKTGRQISALVPMSITTGLVGRGQSVSLTVDGVAAGLRSQSSYAIHLDGSSGPVLGMVRSDESGNISGSVMISSDTQPGEHTIDLTGDGETDEPIDVTQPIYVSANDNDRDSDGIADMIDACPAIANSGQDSDRDGIDDACDGFIAQPPGASDQNDGSAGSGSITDGGGTLGGSSGSRNTSNPGQLAASLLTLTQTYTPVATFVIKASTPASHLLVKSDKSPSAGITLGVHTAHPRSSAHAGVTQLPAPTRNADSRARRYQPKIIRWFPWTLLFIIPVLLVAVLTTLISRLLRKTDQREFMQA